MNAKFHFSTNLTLMTLVNLFILLNSLYLNAQEYAVGADLSFLKQAEDKGFVLRKMANPGQDFRFSKIMVTIGSV